MRLIAIALAASALVLAPPVHAQLKYMEPGQYLHNEFSGSGTHLPVNCRLGWQAIVSWAHQMTPVQAAKREAQRRGYVALSDTAFNRCEHGMSVAVLGYEKPGMRNAAVTLVVTTQVNPDTGEPLTTVAAGMWVVDPSRDALDLADHIQELAATDASFTVGPDGALRRTALPRGMRLMDADEPVVPEPGSAVSAPDDGNFPDPFTPTRAAMYLARHADDQTKAWAMCVFRKTATCLVGTGVVAWAAWRWEPRMMMAAVAGCIVSNMFDCAMDGR